MASQSEIERDPDEFEAIQAVAESLIAEIHTAGPGVIESYDAATGKCSVSLVHQRVYEGDDGEEEALDPPVITGVPVCFPRGGGFAITFPLAKGDPVLVVFAQRSLDAYMETDGATVHDSGDARKHNVSDAIAIPGLYTARTPIDTAHATDLVIAREGGSGEVHIKPNGHVFIKSAKTMIGADAASIAVARGDRTESRLTALENFAVAHMHPTAALGPPSPGALPSPFIPPVAQAVESTKVFIDA